MDYQYGLWETERPHIKEWFLGCSSLHVANSGRRERFWHIGLNGSVLDARVLLDTSRAFGCAEGRLEPTV